MRPTAMRVRTGDSTFKNSYIMGVQGTPDYDGVGTIQGSDLNETLREDQIVRVGGLGHAAPSTDIGLYGPMAYKQDGTFEDTLRDSTFARSFMDSAMGFGGEHMPQGPWQRADDPLTRLLSEREDISTAVGQLFMRITSDHV